MATNDSILARTLKTQKRIGRLAKNEFGLTLESIAFESGIPYATVRSYFSQAANVRLAELPISNFVKLIGVIPDALLSQLLDPADRHLERNEDEDEELDDLADKADEIAREVRRARHPKSPGGVEIIAIEEERIKRLAQGLRRNAA
jgi:predicted transcriptional regulator